MNGIHVTASRFYYESLDHWGCHIVLTDRIVFDPLSWAIRRVTGGEWSHAMLMIRPKEFLSQDWRFHRVDPLDYLKNKHKLKLIEIPISEKQRLEVEKSAENLLVASPSYDWLALLGYLIRNQKTVNFLTKYYCSEIVLHVLKNAGVYSGNTWKSPNDIDRMADDFGWKTLAIYDPTYEMQEVVSD